MFARTRFISIATICLLFFFSFQLSATSATTISVSTDATDVSTAKRELFRAAVLNPIQGEDLNVAAMAQDLVDQVVSGVKVTVIKSSNKQVSKSGAISYGSYTCSGNVTFKLTKNRSSATQTMLVVVPAKALATAQTKVTETTPSTSITPSGAATSPTNTTTSSVAGTDPSAGSTSSPETTTAPANPTTETSAETTSNPPVEATSLTTTNTPTADTAPPQTTVPLVQTDPDAESVNAAKAALTAAGIIKPVEMQDADLTTIIQSIVTTAASGVQASVRASANSQVSSTGVITYGSSAVTGIVTINLTKNQASTTVEVEVTVPAKALVNLVNVKDYGAKGDASTDDTAAIQKAIDYAYSKNIATVYIPDGTYMVNPDTSIRLKSNLKLELSSNAVIKSKSSVNEYYNIILILEANNVEISGGKIIGDRYNHSGSSGEWGAGIGVLGSSNITISNMYISDCWGDGIFIGEAWDKAPNYSQSVTIQGVTCDNNRRQGISVISVKGLLVKDCVLCNTNGTAPMSGIDLEPDFINQYMLDVVLENVMSYNNGNSSAARGGYGLDIWLGGGGSTYAYGVPKENVSITIVNFGAYGNFRGDASPNLKDYIDYGYNINGNVTHTA